MGSELLTVFERSGVPFILTAADYWYTCPGIHRRCQGNLVACTKNCVRVRANQPVRLLWTIRSLRRRRARCRELLNSIAAPLVCISDRVAALYKEDGIDSSKMIVLPWGADCTPAGAGLRLDGGGVRFSYIGRVSAEKGVADLIRAYQLARTDCSLRIYGAGDTEEFQRLAEGTGITFYGRYEPSDLPAILADSDVVVVPSVWEEAYGLVVQEAGRQQVRSRVGRRRVSRPDHTGGQRLFVPPGEPAALARLMERVAGDHAAVRKRLNFSYGRVRLTDDAAAHEELYGWCITNWQRLRSRDVFPAQYNWKSEVGHLSKITGTPAAVVEQKLGREFTSPGSTVAEAWKAAAPKSDEEITRFYQTTDAYLYDLAVVHHTYERKQWRRTAAKLLVEAGVKSLLDYGGGCGYDSVFFAGLGFNCVLYDASPNNVSLALLRAEEARVSIAASTSLPDRQFDGVYCTEVLEHLPDPLAELATMAKRVVPGGVVLLTHSFDLLGDSHPSHLARHKGFAPAFVHGARALGLEYVSQWEIPGNRFLQFRRVDPVQTIDLRSVA